MDNFVSKNLPGDQYDQWGNNITDDERRVRHEETQDILKIIEKLKDDINHSHDGDFMTRNNGYTEIDLLNELISRIIIDRKL